MKTRVFKYSFGQTYTTYWAVEFFSEQFGQAIQLFFKWEDAIAEAFRLEKNRGWDW